MSNVRAIRAQLDNAIRETGIPRAGNELLIALDLDGTILGHNNSITARVHEAYQAHLDAGTHMIIATGRGRQSVAPIVDKLGITDTVMVCSNGNQTVLTGNATIPGTQPRTVLTETDNGLVIRHRIFNIHTMDPEALRGAVIKIGAHLPNALFAVEPIEGPRILCPSFPDGYLAPPYVRKDLEKLIIDDALRLVMITPDMPATVVRRHLGALDLPGVEWATSSSTGSGWVDVGKEGVTKATAVENLRDELGISPSATVAVGDGGNDVDMLSWANLGVAMGQAEPYVRNAARVSTAPFDENGVALLLEAMLEA